MGSVTSKVHHNVIIEKRLRMSQERKSPYYEPGRRVCGYEESLIPVELGPDDLRTAQSLLARWRGRHGGDMSVPEVAMMLTEEVGELAGAIRHGMWSKNIDGERVPYADNGELRDAVGDVILSVVRLCIDLGIDATDCVLETMKSVLPRHYERTNEEPIPDPDCEYLEPELHAGIEGQVLCKLDNKLVYRSDCLICNRKEREIEHYCWSCKHYDGGSPAGFGECSVGWKPVARYEGHRVLGVLGLSCVKKEPNPELPKGKRCYNCYHYHGDEAKGKCAYSSSTYEVNSTDGDMCDGFSTKLPERKCHNCIHYDIPTKKCNALNTTQESNDGVYCDYYLPF